MLGSKASRVPCTCRIKFPFTAFTTLTSAPTAKPSSAKWVRMESSPVIRMIRTISPVFAIVIGMFPPPVSFILTRPSPSRRICVHVHVHVLRSPCGASRAPLMLRRTCRRFAAVAGIRTRCVSCILLLLVWCYIR